MPSVTLNLYDQYRKNNFNGGAVDFDTDTIKCAIVTASYTPDQNLHDFWDDANSNEVSGTGYTAGGNLMDNGVVSVDGSGNVTVDLDDPSTWAQDASGFNDGRYAIVYKDTATASTSPLIGYGDLGSNKGNVDGDFSVAVNASGLITSAR
jgi:hypothetical protein